MGAHESRQEGLSDSVTVKCMERTRPIQENHDGTKLILNARQCNKHLLCIISIESYNTVRWAHYHPILYLKKLRQKVDLMKHGQGHIVYKWQGWALNPDVSGSEYYSSPPHYAAKSNVGVGGKECRIQLLGCPRYCVVSGTEKHELMQVTTLRLMGCPITLYPCYSVMAKSKTCFLK